MAENKFSNNKKTKIIAAAVADSMDYVKGSKSYMSNGELKGKKYGKSYKVYIPDPGTVHEGLEADPDGINEIETEVFLDNRNTSVELSAWNNLTDVESFRDEIALPRARKLASAVQKAIVEKNAYRSAQAVVGDASFKTLSSAAGKLFDVKADGDKVSFSKPSVLAAIAETGLARFIPSDIQKDIYEDKYLGQYAGAAQVELADMPVIKGKGGTATVVSTAIVEGSKTIGYHITGLGGANAGEAYSIPGLKVVDLAGIESDNDFVVIAGEDIDITVVIKGEKVTNAQAWVEAAQTFTANSLLEANKEYFVGQCRTKEALAFDTYDFDDLPGSENARETIDGITVQMATFGNGKSRSALVRLDLPFASKVIDPRQSVTMYIAK